MSVGVRYSVSQSWGGVSTTYNLSHIRLQINGRKTGLFQQCRLFFLCTMVFSLNPDLDKLQKLHKNQRLEQEVGGRAAEEHAMAPHSSNGSGSSTTTSVSITPMSSVTMQVLIPIRFHCAAGPSNTIKNFRNLVILSVWCAGVAVTCSTPRR